ncbi:MAG: hypothetical protein R3C14_44775 [Caldilineaceae bacterium]
MKLIQQQTGSRAKVYWLLICFICSALLLPARAYADLPPRPTEPPGSDKKADKPSRPQVAPLVLNTSPAQSGLWSVVQWQDAQGDWQDVESWRGWVANGKTIWWVEEKDFGKGPFRWAIFQTEGGKLLAVSEPFYLPTEVRRTMTIAVSLP